MLEFKALRAFGLLSVIFTVFPTLSMITPLWSAVSKCLGVSVGNLHHDGGAVCCKHAIELYLLLH